MIAPADPRVFLVGFADGARYIKGQAEFDGFSVRCLEMWAWCAARNAEVSRERGQHSGVFTGYMAAIDAAFGVP